jgi:hypothetical protein
MPIEISFCPGDGVAIKRDRKKQWIAHCVVDGIRRSANSLFTVLRVYEPRDLVNATGSHPQWIVYDDGSDVVGIANGNWFTHKIPKGCR